MYPEFESLEDQFSAYCCTTPNWPDRLDCRAMINPDTFRDICAREGTTSRMICDYENDGEPMMRGFPVIMTRRVPKGEVRLLVPATASQPPHTPPTPSEAPREHR
jgi:glutamine synthetase